MQLLIPWKSRAGITTNADRDFQLLCPTVFEANQMGFVNEVVSDEDIARYNLPFKPGDGRYWTRDREQDCYLWGGIVENYSREYIPEGRFWLFIRETLLDVSLNVDSVNEQSPPGTPKIVWKEVSHIQPIDLGGLDFNEVLSVLRDALTVYGVDGEENRPTPGLIVQFKF